MDTQAILEPPFPTGLAAGVRLSPPVCQRLDVGGAGGVLSRRTVVGSIGGLEGGGGMGRAASAIRLPLLTAPPLPVPSRAISVSE